MLLRTFQFIGGALFFSGIIIVTYLQLKLSRSLERNLFTFVSVLILPKHDLDPDQIRFRRLGSYLMLSGLIFIIGTGYDVIWESITGFSDPPKIIPK